MSATGEEELSGGGPKARGNDPTMAASGESPTAQPGNGARGVPPALALAGLVKSYGPTHALLDAHLSLAAGEILGLVGHNGAGKTTLVKIIAGMLDADGGTVEICGHTMPPRYGVREARRRGVSVALQEISLCPDLIVEENLALVRPEIVRRGWRKRARQRVSARLDEIFPLHGIARRARVDRLSLAQRQMLQIALASLSAETVLRLLILDEPTSALPEEFADSLFKYLAAAKRTTGLAVLLVSHKMDDILGHTDRTAVMRDGRVVAEHATRGLTTEIMLRSMGAADGVSEASRSTRGRLEAGAPEACALSAVHWRSLRNVSLSVRRGEIVGLAGLEGNGQRDVLGAVWRMRRTFASQRGLRRRVQVRGRVGYVSGDRQVEGIFPLWSVRENLTISVLRRLRRRGTLSFRAERAETERWIERVAIKAAGETRITSLSGGNQQKVLLARGLALEPHLLLLDDPFRGVDITTKVEAYNLLREEASRGRAILWYTTENAELLECDRVYVLRSGEVAAILSGDELTVDQVIAASFAHVLSRERES